jgi:hypothetical protein
MRVHVAFALALSPTGVAGTQAHLGSDGVDGRAKLSCRRVRET